jgi:protein phosphatase 1 regulatory subunit 7
MEGKEGIKEVAEPMEIHEANSTEDEIEDDSQQQRHAQVVGALPLDWTRVERKEQTGEDGSPAEVVRLPQDVVQINKEDEDLVIVGTAGQKITKMGNNLSDFCSPHLKQLILRSHLIHTMEGLSGFVELELLELYDNSITALSALNEGVNGSPGHTLRVLDMSYNVIRDMKPVEACPNLQELYLANNKLKSMAGLRGLTRLRKIDLGANRIREMNEEELSGLINLEELWLGKNKIEEIKGISKVRAIIIQIDCWRMTSDN